MSTWLGLFFALKPGHEDEVAQIFETSGRPDHDVRDESGEVVGRLLRTLVFVGKEKAVRVIEIEGDLMTVSRHMARQDEVRELEEKLEAHLAVPRDMRSPEGAMKFFAEAGMRCVVNRTDRD
jgi:SchA/CurD like domain